MSIEARAARRNVPLVNNAEKRVNRDARKYAALRLRVSEMTTSARLRQARSPWYQKTMAMAGTQ